MNSGDCIKESGVVSDMMSGCLFSSACFGINSGKQTKIPVKTNKSERRDTEEEVLLQICWL